MEAAVEALGRELGKLRTGRATPARQYSLVCILTALNELLAEPAGPLVAFSAGMLDHVVVSAYGSLTPLNRVATVSLADAHTLAVTLYDPSLLHEVEKGITESPMGLNPAQGAGGSLTVNVPKLTQETRQAMIKLAIKAGEAAKVSIRRARKEGLEELKGAKDEEGMSEDEVKRQSKEVQELTNSFTKKVEDTCGSKERELSAS
eukprot:SM000132S26913  [mRNA]  locus=s132:326619:328386:- [translate_table: standard]